MRRTGSNETAPIKINIDKSFHRTLRLTTNSNCHPGGDMTEIQGSEISTEQPAEKKPPRGVVFALVSAAAMIVIPAVTAGAIIITVLLQPSFYTGILKNGRFITAFVEARNWQTEKQIDEEIERDVHITKFTEEFEASRAAYERARREYDAASRDGEIESLKKQRKDLKDMDWKQVRDTFPDEKDFEKNRDVELKKIKENIAAVEDYQDKNSDRIKDSRKKMKKARGEYEDALSTLEDKKEDVKKITDRHRNTFSSKLYADLELIEGPLSKILNERLIEGPVRREIEKVIRFVTSYETQIAQRNIYYEHLMTARRLGRRSLRVKFPEIEISLYVAGDVHGAARKKHILSELLVDELKRIDTLQNRTLLMTLFRMSDTSLGEYFGGKYLGKLGISIDSGTIRLSNVVLRGNAAERAAEIMLALTWGQYAVYGAAGLLLLFILFLFFSAVERRRKLGALKRLFIVPSLFVIAACGALLWATRNIFAYFPDLIENLSARSYVKHLGFIAAWHFTIPLLIVFGAFLAAGLVIRKYLVRSAGSASKK